MASFLVKWLVSSSSKVDGAYRIAGNQESVSAAAISGLVEGTDYEYVQTKTQAADITAAAAATAASVATTAATSTTPFGYAQAQADAIVTAVNALIVDVAAIRTKLTTVLAALDTAKVTA